MDSHHSTCRSPYLGPFYQEIFSTDNRLKDSFQHGRFMVKENAHQYKEVKQKGA